MKRILVLPDDWETWVSLEGDLKPEVWNITDQAYERLEQEGWDPGDLLREMPGAVRHREPVQALRLFEPGEPVPR